MKKLIIAAAALGLCVQVAFSQGTVNFINSGAFSITADRFVYQDAVGGTKLVGTNYVAILYWGRTADALNNFAVRATGDETYARAYAAFRDVLPTSSAAGTWAGGPRTFMGATTGDQLWLQIRVWDLSKGATIEEGRTGGLWGQSDPFQYTVAAPTDAAGLKINNMRAFALVPEPSTIALGVLGLGSLLLFRRKKA
jgi:hypothetical protein